MPVKANKKANDRTNCTWPLFTAISDVMMQAKKGRLEPEDLLDLPASDNVSEQSETLKKSWERTLRHFHRDQAAKKAAELANPAAAAAKKKKEEELPSLAKALWPQVRGLWRVAFGLYLVSIGLAFLGPFLLGRTVQLLVTTQQCGLREQQAQQASVELESEGNLLSDEPPTVSAACRESSRIHLGYIYAAAMLVVKLCEALFRSWHDHLMTRLALRARAAIIGTIYRKCLWLSGMGAGDTTTGRIQNLMANDAQFFLQIAPMFNNLFVAPLQIVVCFVWLAWLIGPSFLAGVCALCFSVPCQATVLKVYFKAQIERLKVTDQRIKLTNEMVQGMRVVKMYAWEQTIGSKLAEVRAKELRLVRRQRFMSAFLSVFMTTQPLFLTVSTFSVYAASGQPLEAQTVLPALALLSLLRMPIAFLPMIIMQLLNLKVALGRITKFLMNEELPDEAKARSLGSESSFREGRTPASPPMALSEQMGEILSETPDTRVVMSSVLQNAADGAAAALELVSSALAADDDLVESEESVRLRTKPQEPAPAASLPALAEEADITIEGTFAWQKIEVEAGKGKGKGKGKGGGGRGGGGRGGGSAPPKRSLTSRLTFKVSRKKPDAASAAVVAGAASAADATKAGADAQSEPSSPPSRGGRGRGSSAAPPAAEEKTTPPILKQVRVRIGVRVRVRANANTNPHPVTLTLTPTLTLTLTLSQP